MPLPKISLITPSFNQGKFIQSTINSVLSQNYPNLEYIVVDGGSTDNTLNILKSYGSRLIWSSQKDRGQTHAINKGLTTSTGDILGYLNSDDILLPKALDAVGKYFHTHPECDWLTGDCVVIGVDGKPTKGSSLIHFYKKFLFSIYSPRLLKIVDNMLPQPSTFWSRRAYQKIGPFNEKLHYVMDYDYWLRLSQYFTPHNLPIPLSGFRAQPQSKSETSRHLLMKEGDQVLIANGASPLDLTLHRLHSNVVKIIYHLLKP